MVSVFLRPPSNYGQLHECVDNEAIGRGNDVSGNKEMGKELG